MRHVEERSVNHAVRWDDFQEGAQVCNTPQSCHELDLSHTHTCTCEECHQVRNTKKTEKCACDEMFCLHSDHCLQSSRLSSSLFFTGRGWDCCLSPALFLSEL